ncbi:MAG: c-type cytochrome [Mesorhizobium sp.]
MRLAGKLAISAAVLAGLSAAAFWWLTTPRTLAAAEVAAFPAGDAAEGERIFWAAGCSSCHAAPGAEGEARLSLAGGLQLKTGFGTFVAPNISSHPTDGIGAWDIADFANAMQRGVSPDGRHYYPAFPYTSYARMTPDDVADLFAFLKTVPAAEGKAPETRLGFPFNIRRGVGLWKLLHLDPAPVASVEGASAEVLRGQYLVEGPGHCGECHTPRDLSGGLRTGEWLAGAVAAEGEGVVPNITPQGLAWSAGDIAYYLESGFTPDFDSVGGAMVDVQKNMAMLPAEDRAAIAAYLKAIPGRPNGYPAR